MYRVLIVDDEHLVCALLKKLIHWDALELTLLDTASDGVHAWEIIRSERPEIVITDIRMPGMDGLALAQRASEQGIDSNFILISGHTEFSYAFHAIKYGVEDYLIKPIDEQELNNVLAKICEKREEKALHLKNNTLLKISLHKLQTNYLRKVIQGECNPTGLADFNDNMQASFIEGSIRLIAVCLDVSANAEQDENLLYTKAQEIVSAAFSRLSAQTVCLLEEHRLLCLVNYLPALEEDFAAAGRTLLDDLFTRMNLYRQCSVTLAVSQATADMSAIRRLAEQTADAVCARLSLGPNQLIWYEKLPIYECHTVISEAALKELQNCVEACDLQRLTLFFNRLLSAVVYAEISDADRLKEIDRLLHTFFQMIAGTEQAETDILEIRKKVAACTDYQKICEELNPAIAQTYEKYLNSIRQKTVRPVHQAQQYIQEHLDGDLTLEQVASQVYLNPAYFSSMFKSETGVNFSKYVAAERVNRAKEYLRDPSLSIAQVAERVGYRDKKHFSKLFKKVTGIYPSDYRKLHL